jgi:hypothetical protein
MYVQQRSLGATPITTLSLSPGVSRLAQAMTSGRPAPTTFEIIPPEYQRLESPVPTVGPTVGPGTVAVFAWPFVLLSDEQIRRTLDAISTPSGAVGPAVVTGLATAAAATTGDAVARANALAPAFLACGFLRDPGVNQAITRGYLWVAASWTQSQPTTVVSRAMKATMGAALAAAGASFSTTPTRPSAGQVGSLQTVPVVASGESDSALEDAAAKGVLAVAQAAVAITGALFGNVSVSFTASKARSDIASAANVATNAARCLQEAPTTVSQVDALTAQALSQPPAAQAAAGAALMQVKRRLSDCKTALVTAATQAPGILRMCELERDPSTSQVAKALRDQIVSDAQSKLAVYANVPSVARKFAMTALWRRAQTQLEGSLRGLSDQISSMCATSQTLVDNGTSVQALVAAIDAAIAKLDYTYSQLQISWWQRDWLGVPAYVWIGGGTVIVVGGVAWRIRVKRRRAAEGVTKNRRRRAS